jgi:hypothetical protein
MFGRVGPFMAACGLAICIMSATPVEARFLPNGQAVSRAEGVQKVRHVRRHAHRPRVRAVRVRRHHWHHARHQMRRHHRHAIWGRPLFVASPGFQPGCTESQRQSYVGHGWLRVETVRVCYLR